MINQVYLGITVSALLLINIIDYKAYKYIKANYKGNANYNRRNYVWEKGNTIRSVFFFGVVC